MTAHPKAIIRPAWRVTRVHLLGRDEPYTAKRWGFEMIVDHHWHSRSMIRRDLEIAASEMGATVTTELT